MSETGDLGGSYQMPVAKCCNTAVSAQTSYVLDGLEPHHRLRLDWFYQHEGCVVPFPPPLDGGLHLATRAKGIYKPAGSPYALSVRSMLSSPYADKTVERFPDGSWRFLYFQENVDPASVSAEYTNRALLQCRRDSVPLGAMVQRCSGPTQYEVLGLALVTDWEEGYFTLESVVPG